MKGIAGIQIEVGERLTEPGRDQLSVLAIVKKIATGVEIVSGIEMEKNAGMRRTGAQSEEAGVRKIGIEIRIKAKEQRTGEETLELKEGKIIKDLNRMQRVQPSVKSRER